MDHFVNSMRGKLSTLVCVYVCEPHLWPVADKWPNTPWQIKYLTMEAQSLPARLLFGRDAGMKGISRVEERIERYRKTFDVDRA